MRAVITTDGFVIRILRIKSEDEARREAQKIIKQLQTNGGVKVYIQPS